MASAAAAAGAGAACVTSVTAAAGPFTEPFRGVCLKPRDRSNDTVNHSLTHAGLFCTIKQHARQPPGLDRITLGHVLSFACPFLLPTPTVRVSINEIINDEINGWISNQLQHGSMEERN